MNDAIEVVSPPPFLVHRLVIRIPTHSNSALFDVYFQLWLYESSLCLARHTVLLSDPMRLSERPSQLLVSFGGQLSNAPPREPNAAACLCVQVRRAKSVSGSTHAARTDWQDGYGFGSSCGRPPSTAVLVGA